jgi:HEAT repeat protein
MQNQNQDRAAEIMSMGEAQALGILRNAESTFFEKAKACQRLAVVGTKAAVPALGPLLSDAKLAHYARFALEPIPDREADKTLRKAMERLSGRLRAGVIASIGQRKDPKAVKPLSKLLHDADAEVAAAAAFALGKIANKDAAKRLEKGIRKHPTPALAHAGLACADALTSSGDARHARPLYIALQNDAIPKAVRLEAAPPDDRMMKR